MNYDDLVDIAFCAICDTKLENVRPGKHQHPGDTLRLCETIASLQRDALRYRWWRKQYAKGCLVPSVVLGKNDEDQLDAATDEAMQRE